MERRLRQDSLNSSTSGRVRRERKSTDRGGGSDDHERRKWEPLGECVFVNSTLVFLIISIF